MSYSLSLNSGQTQGPQGPTRSDDPFLTQLLENNTPTPPSLTSGSSPASSHDQEDSCFDQYESGVTQSSCHLSVASGDNDFLPDWPSPSSNAHSAFFDDNVKTPSMLTSESPLSYGKSPSEKTGAVGMDTELPAHPWLHDVFSPGEPSSTMLDAPSNKASDQDDTIFRSMIEQNNCAPPAAFETQSVIRSSPDTTADVACMEQDRTDSPSAVSGAYDASMPLMAARVIRPDRNQLPQPMKLLIHGIPEKGAKSRVETQIRMRLELVAQAPNSTPGASQAWERIGSFSHIKVPPLSGTKRKSKKHQRSNVPIETTLQLEAEVVNATPPHARVFVCNSCREREWKRAHRKKSKNAIQNANPTKDEMRALGIDPDTPDALQMAAERLEEEERKHIVLFNCGDYVDFSNGEAVLSSRITCYCRHHREKVGFYIIFTLRTHLGEFVATGSTPPIMIMDDHKSTSQGAVRNALRSDDSPSVGELGRPRDRARPYDDLATRRRFRASDLSGSDTSRTSFAIDQQPGFAWNTTSPTVDRSATGQNPATSEELPSPDGLLAPSAFLSPPVMDQAPIITKVIPAEGPTSGGIEITVLGENFVNGLQCVFGDTPSTLTRVWAKSTLVCLLPPTIRPGPVVVSLQRTDGPISAAASSGAPLQLFTYIDDTDRALMELALQVVGLQMTGQMTSARDVAMRIVTASQGSSASMPTGGATDTIGGAPTSLSRGETSDLLSLGRSLLGGRNKPMSLQDLVITLLRFPQEAQQPNASSDAIYACNRLGHTLLHLAVMNNFHRLAADLLRRGCPVNARDANGWSPLHFAALHDRAHLARILLQNGADPYETTDDGLVPIEIAARYETIDVEHVLEEWTGGSDASESDDAALTFAELAELEQPSTPLPSAGSETQQHTPKMAGEHDGESIGMARSPPPTYDEATTNLPDVSRHIEGEKLITEENKAALRMANSHFAPVRALRARSRLRRERAREATVVRARQGVQGDHMLLWFWIPAMVVVILITVFLQLGWFTRIDNVVTVFQRAVEL